MVTKRKPKQAAQAAPELAQARDAARAAGETARAELERERLERTQASAQAAPTTAQAEPPAQAAQTPPRPAQARPGARLALAPGARPALPGKPRNYQEETRTLAQACAELPAHLFAWPTPAPFHGVRGFSELAGWAAQELTGGEQTPEQILGDSKDALLVLISNAKYLEREEVIKNDLIAEHDQFGQFYLRCVRHPKDGFLIGVIDDQGATYGAAEWYETLDDCAEAWKDWIAVINKDME